MSSVHSLDSLITEILKLCPDTSRNSGFDKLGGAAWSAYRFSNYLEPSDHMMGWLQNNAETRALLLIKEDLLNLNLSITHLTEGVYLG